jgi:hypothetical protein
MDSSIASAVNPMTGQELMPTSLQSGSGVSAGSQPMSGGESSAVTTPQPAAKRRPGRPKGSGKKSSELSQRSTPVSKMKRPVGRPRKDGFPAGSVGPRRSNRTTKSAADPSSSGAGASSMFAYPGVRPPSFCTLTLSLTTDHSKTISHTPHHHGRGGIPLCTPHQWPLFTIMAQRHRCPPVLHQTRPLSDMNGRIFFGTNRTRF